MSNLESIRLEIILRILLKNLLNWNLIDILEINNILKLIVFRFLLLKDFYIKIK